MNWSTSFEWPKLARASYSPTGLESRDRARLQVYRRATRRCEYCLIHENDSAFAHEVDHVISRQHGGATELENLALACLICNRNKGTNLASLGPDGVLVRLFDPRRDQWTAHFRLEGPIIESLSPQGIATIRLLKFNVVERVMERRLLQLQGTYPR